MLTTTHLTLNEVRENLNRFSVEWKGAGYERGQAQGFWREFFACFGISGKSAVLYEHQVRKLGGARGYIDSFIPGKLIVEAKSSGGDLNAAFDQAEEYALALAEAERPRYVVVSDFQRFILIDLSKDKVTEISLSSLAPNAERFRFLLDEDPEEIAEEREADRAAAYRISKLHKMLLDGGLKGEALDVFLTRLLFLFFADDTGLLTVNGSFHRLLKKTATSNLYGTLTLLFRMLDMKPENRPGALDEDIARFPFINGALFEKDGEFPVFDTKTRDVLMECSSLDWSGISPAIFGAMFQGILEGEFKSEGDEPVSRQATRREMGAHYTSERNIMRVIRPLFLNDLRSEFEIGKSDHERLKELYDRLPTITLLDPACGCGSFLVVAFRELRRLELDILSVMFQDRDLSQINVGDHVRVNVKQMHGIELFDSPAQIAKVALWITDHQISMDAASRFGSSRRSLPLTDSPTIKVGNALRVPWEEVIPATFCDYVIGNPPFSGKQYQTDEQKADLDVVFGRGKNELIKGRGVLDFVTAWFVKAAQYIEKSSATARELDIFASDDSAWGSRGNDDVLDIDSGWENWRPTQVGLVATSSIVQGEQVGVLWAWMLEQGMHITFAHRTFAWANEGKGNAAVHCVIIGFSSDNPDTKRLFSYPDIKGEPVETFPSNISPYLVDAPDVLVRQRRTPLNPGTLRMDFGSMPNDGGFLSKISESQATEIRNTDPVAAKYLRRLVGSVELINDIPRYCLWLVDAKPADIRSSPILAARTKGVRDTRTASTRVATQRLANRPTEFGEIRQPTTTYLGVPSISSGTRRYLPVKLLGKDTISNNKLLLIPGAPVSTFGILGSLPFNLWNGAVSGRLKSDFQIGVTTTYNTFPFPQLDSAQSTELEEAAQAVVDVRATFTNSSLADLYDSDAMPGLLRDAHARVDRVLLKGMGLAANSSDETILAALLRSYSALTVSPSAVSQP